MNGGIVQHVVRVGDGIQQPPRQPPEHHVECPYMGEIPPHKHDEHHKFLEECAAELREFLAERKRARERWEKFQSAWYGAVAVAIVGGIVSGLAWLGTFAMEAFRHWVQSGGAVK